MTSPITIPQRGPTAAGGGPVASTPTQYYPGYYYESKRYDAPASPASSVSSSTLAPSTSHGDRRKTPSSWDPNDDLVLRHLKEQLKLGWKEIASHFPNRTTNACQFRWRRLMSGTLKHSPSPRPAQATPVLPGQGDGSPKYETDIQAQSQVQVQRMPPLPPPHQPASHQSLPPLGVALHPVQSLPTPDSAPMHMQAMPPISSFVKQEESGARPWSKEEDELLLSRKDLRADELSLLLPQRSEAEIRERTSQLLVQQQTASGLLTPATPSSLSSSPRSEYGFNRPTLTRPTSSYFDGLRLPLPQAQRRFTVSTPAPYSPNLTTLL